jgi:peptidoglycan hydrolase CwlO-like protein
MRNAVSVIVTLISIFAIFFLTAVFLASVTQQEIPVSKLPDKIAQLAIVQEKLIAHIAGLQGDIAALKAQLAEAPTQDELDKLQESIDKLVSVLPDAPSVITPGN